MSRSIGLREADGSTGADVMRADWGRAYLKGRRKQSGSADKKARQTDLAGRRVGPLVGLISGRVHAADDRLKFKCPCRALGGIIPYVTTCSRRKDTAGALTGAAYLAKTLATPIPTYPTRKNMTKALTILLGCLALAVTVHAHPGAQGKDGNHADTPADLLAKYDKNGDGKLDASELAALTSADRAALDRHRRHHGHPGRGDGDGQGDGKGRGKGGPGKGGPSGPGGKGDGRGDDAGRDKDGPDGKGEGRGKGGPGKGGPSGPGGKGTPGGKGKAI